MELLQAANDRAGSDGQADEFLNGRYPTIADCSLASLAGFMSEFYSIELPRECVRIIEWYTRFSTRPSAHPPEYPQELRSLARRQTELSRCRSRMSWIETLPSPRIPFPI